MNKVVITVVGRDHPGIIAGVCGFLADENANILNINQTIVDGYFNMMMISDFSDCQKDFSVIQEGLTLLGDKMAVQINCQREEIFTSMHRL